MNRRHFLRRGSWCCLGVLAGCSSPGNPTPSDERDPEREVFVANDRQESITVTLSATRDATDLFSHTYTLAPGHGDESESIAGTPTEIRVSIRDGRTVTRAYSYPSTCESPEVNVRIKPDTVTLNNGCVSS